MDRRSRTRLPPRRAQTSTAVAAAKEVRPPPFSTCPCDCLPWLQRGLEAAEETLRPDNDDREVESEHDESLVGRVEQETADGLDKADQYAGEKAAENAAEPAQCHHDVCQESKARADVGKNVIESREHGAGDSDAAEPDRPTEREHALGWNAHHCCRLAILRSCLQPQTRLGARHEPPQRGERQEADAASDQLRLADEDRSDLHAAGNEWIGDGAKVGRPEELGGGTQRDTKAEGAADLREHRRLQQRADDAEVRQYARKGEEDCHHWQRQQRIEPAQSPEPEGREHGEHEKLAMGEVHDLHQPKNQAQPDRHKRIDQAHQEPADHGLQDEFCPHQRAQTSKQPNRLTSPCKTRSNPMIWRSSRSHWYEFERSTAMKFRVVVLGCVAILAGAASANAQQEVKIGLLYPLSGPTAQIGLDAVAAIRTAVDIVNEGADLPLALAKNKGLPGLGGAKVTLVVVDHQGKPEVGQSETERLITQEKVHALLGAYFSSVTAAASQAAERAGVPFVNADSTQPALTQRGLQYFFRTTPTDENFSELMFDFLKDFGAKSGQKFQSVSLFHEDTAYGTDSSKVQERLAKARGFRVLEKIAYKAQTTSLTAEVQRLKAANADVLLPSSYTSDTFLLLRTAKDLDYNPKLIVAQNAGFTDPTFISTMGKDAEGAITRSPYNSDLEGRIPLLSGINAIFKKHSNGRDLSDVPARAFTGFMTLLDALNRARSTDPEKVRTALAATNIPSDQLILPYRGIKFDASGQNELVRPILMQVQKGRYCTIYPFELASCD